jgi:hypothetical protein
MDGVLMETEGSAQKNREAFGKSEAASRKIYQPERLVKRFQLLNATVACRIAFGEGGCQGTRSHRLNQNRLMGKCC